MSVMDTQSLKKLIKESIREVLQEERLNLCKILIPEVDDQELAELEHKFGMPDDYKCEEFIDMTDWVRNGD
jgi:hypothetical protein